MNTTFIQLASRSVGLIRVDPLRVRGEGGPWDPRLVVPSSIELHPTPERSMIVATHLVARLHTESPAMSVNQVGGPSRLDLVPGMFARSLPNAPNAHQIDVAFPLSAGAIARLEAIRHQREDKAFRLVVSFELGLSWVREMGSSLAQADQPLDGNSGLVSSLWPFWTVRVDPLDELIPLSTWVDQVLPSLGLTHTRLIAIQLPLGGATLPPTVLASFDEARRDLDAGRYRECVQKCRDIRTAVEKHLKATKTRTIDQVVAEAVGLDPGSAEQRLLEMWWRGLVDSTSISHHANLSPTRSYATARAVLLGTAVVLEYLERLLAP